MTLSAPRCIRCALRMPLVSAATVAALFSCTPAPRPEPLQGLADDIRALCDTMRATVGVAVITDRGDTLSFGERAGYPMMSVVKFHQALALLDSLDRAGLPLSTSVEISREDLLPDTWSPLRDARPEGGAFTVAECLAYSVAESDNNVCDRLFRLLGGPARVARYVASTATGPATIVADEEKMHERTENQYLNHTTPLGAARLLERFRRGELLRPETTGFLMRTMLATSTGPGKLRGELPEGTPVAHKTGSATSDVRGILAGDNDIGIVRLPDGRSYSIAVFIRDSHEGEECNAAVIARISRMVYDRVLTLNKTGAGAE